MGKLTKKETLINGIMAGIVFMMKYTMIGLWVGFGLFILIDYIVDKKYKDGLKFCLWFILGMLIPIGICVLYMLIRGGLKDFIDCYFIINATAYSNKATSLISNFKQMIHITGGAFKTNGKIIIYLIALLPLYIFGFKNQKKNLIFRLGILSMLFFSIFFIYWGLKNYLYYFLPITIYLIIALLGIVKFISRFIDKFILKKYTYIFFMIVPIICIFLSYKDANFVNVRAWSKKMFFQFKYAEYIKDYKNPTLLNMGFLDGGLYTTTGIIPNTRFFELQNLDYDRYPDNIDEMKKAVMKKKVKFILYYTKENIKYIENEESYILDNYELVYDDTYYFENSNWNAYLFKLKGLKK